MKYFSVKRKMSKEKKIKNGRLKKITIMWIYNIRSGSNIRFFFFYLHFKYIRGTKYFSVKLKISKEKKS